MRKVQACLAMLSLLVTAVVPPLPAQDTPADAVRQFLLRTQAGDWRGAVGLVTTETQRAFRDMAIMVLVQSAEANVRQAGGQVAPPQPSGRPAPLATRLALLDTIPVVGLRRPFTLGELARLGPDALLEEALALRYTAQQGREVRLLGTIEENDSTSWALLRQVFPNAPAQLATAPGGVSVAPLNRRAEGWRLGYATGLFSPSDVVSPTLRSAAASSGTLISVQAMPGSSPWPASPDATVAECDPRRVHVRIASRLPEAAARPYVQAAEFTVLTSLRQAGRIAALASATLADSVAVLTITLSSISDREGIRVDLGLQRGATEIPGARSSVVTLPGGLDRAEPAALSARLTEMLEGFSAGGLPGPCR